MNIVRQFELSSPGEDDPPEGTRRVISGVERVFYDGYWIKTYPAPADSLDAKKRLIEALTRRLFNHTEHGMNVPGTRLCEARKSYDSELDPGKRRVKAAMLAGALFNRATDIFRKLVELQADGVEIQGDDALMRECGQCLMEAMELGRYVLHRSGEEGIDELWGEPFKAFSIPVEDFYESRYIKIGQTMRDIDQVADVLIDTFDQVPAFAGIEPLVREFALSARIKTETLRTDPQIFDVWADMVTAGERLANFSPLGNTGCYVIPVGHMEEGLAALHPERRTHSLSDGLQLLRNGRDLIFHITRARTPMPKSTREFVDRCHTYLDTGRVPFMPAPLPA